MRSAKSPSSLVASDTRLLGQDSRGHWVVKESCGQFGAVFFNRAEAVKFGLFDGGRSSAKSSHSSSGSSRTRDAQDNAREEGRRRAGLCHERCKASTRCLNLWPSRHVQRVE